MPTPTNVRALQVFLGWVQYLVKFVPSLLTVTEPLRQLECKNTQWCWLPARDQAISKLKQMLCEAPVLRYFDPSKPITLQCDASESDLGYFLLQEHQSVAYGARGLTAAEKNYAQIEKEMLAIVAGCENLINTFMVTRFILRQITSPLSQLQENLSTWLQSIYKECF